ncbi:M20 family metallopeptidase [Candidatus Bipolaricaulota bacterium]|nr:M20 family metallopeptidase [Candidatus Bipolaricaulota bacterium]
MTELELDELKKQIGDELDGLSGKLRELGEKIFENPELKFEEYKAMNWLTEALEEKGFSVEREIGGMETSFIGRCPNGSEGPTVAFLCEYDALPRLGHACGHNLIATIGLGAGLALCSVMDKLNGQVVVIGTPAEEGGGGKIELVEAGIFDDVDVAMMVHPSSKTLVGRGSLGVQELTMDFYGKSAHAASQPEEGINALDAVISTFNNINALREHIKESSRIHGVITDGGEKPNIVPDHAAACFYVRAAEMGDLEELLKKVKNCAEAGALAAGAELEITEERTRYCPVEPNPALVDLFADNIVNLGEEIEEHEGGMGSTDMGNVSQEVPAIHSYIKIAEEETPGHSTEFAEASNSDKGYSAMVTAAKALAMTGAEVLGNDENLQAVKKEFKGD